MDLEQITVGIKSAIAAPIATNLPRQAHSYNIHVGESGQRQNRWLVGDARSRPN